MDNHEVKFQEHDRKFPDPENAVAELNSRRAMIRSQPASKKASGSADWVEQHVGFRVCDFEERNTQGGSRRPEIEAFRNSLVDRMDPCYQAHTFEPVVLARDNYKFTIRVTASMVKELNNVITSMIEERTEGLSIKNMAGDVIWPRPGFDQTPSQKARYRLLGTGTRPSWR